MAVHKSGDYRKHGPLIYEDPNSLGPKDRFILVRVNMFDHQGVHPKVIEQYVKESLKTQEN